ncbi:uncharacterized protein BDV14DRAFT_173372 [Aspergillus stella-maris]|uniref:uncharacterized protein n=1 Tax=Aspergillus stella-maris TaxID=1810926 RepID=UPI003CCCFD3E
MVYPHHCNLVVATSSTTPVEDAVTEEPVLRAQQRIAIFDLEDSIDSISADEFSFAELRELNVDVRSLTLDENSPNKPFFFTRDQSLPSSRREDLIKLYHELHEADVVADPEVIERPMDQAQGFYYAWNSCTHPLRFSNRASSPWSGGDPGDYVQFKDIYQYEQPEFGAYEVTQVANDSLPHRKAIIYNNLKGKEGHITRGEILDILRLMIPQFVRRRFKRHMVFPMFVLSFMGRHARIIEAFFDSRKNLVLRTTRLFTFPEETVSGFPKLDWYFNFPSGNTKKPFTR